MKKLTALFITSLIAACGTTLVVPTKQDVDRISNQYPGVTLADLMDGKNTYQQNCSACHAFKKLNSKTEEQWNKIVPVMVNKANRKAGKELIDGKQKETLLKYIITMRTAQ